MADNCAAGIFRVPVGVVPPIPMLVDADFGRIVKVPVDCRVALLKFIVSLTSSTLPVAVLPPIVAATNVTSPSTPPVPVADTVIVELPVEAMELLARETPYRGLPFVPPVPTTEIAPLADVTVA